MTQSFGTASPSADLRERSDLQRSKRHANDPGLKRSPILNDYGDQGLKLPESLGFGTDINQGRMDDLDGRALRFVSQLVKTHSRRIVGYDVGCGYGHQAIAFALAGADVHCVDLSDTHAYIEAQLAAQARSAKSATHLGGITFHRNDVRALNLAAVSNITDFFYSQRTLHYLPYADMSALFRKLRPTLRPHARLFIGISGINSPLREGYPHANRDVKDRFAPLNIDDPEIKKHDILQPVCLYSKFELSQLFTDLGYRAIDVRESTFGNVKGVFAVK